jgi:uncharacterized membrane protein YhaH (DUF805 family)
VNSVTKTIIWKNLWKINGRIGRKEFGSVIGGLIVICAALIFVMGMIDMESVVRRIGYGVMLVVGGYVAVSCCVKRMHDLDWAAWAWLLIAGGSLSVPYIYMALLPDLKGGASFAVMSLSLAYIYFITIMVGRKGKQESNRFGAVDGGSMLSTSVKPSEQRAV